MGAREGLWESEEIMRHRITKVIAAAEPKGDVEAVRELGKEALKEGAQAITLLGSFDLQRCSAPRVRSCP